MKFAAFALSALTLLTLSGCTDNAGLKEDAPFYVATTLVDKPIATVYKTFRGVVVPAEQTPFGFRIAGEISQLNVKAGDLVKKGQLLAKLENSKESQDLADAKAKHSLAVRQLNRAKELLGKQMVSKAEYDELLANRRLTAANLNLVQNQYNYTSLYAPFSGKVSDVFKERFEPTGEGEAIINLYQNDKVYVRVELTDNLLALIDPTQSKKMRQYQPEVSFMGMDSDESYAMNFLEYATEPDEYTKAYQLFISMKQPEEEILPGTIANVLVDMASAGIPSVPGFQVPLTALVPGNKEDEFFVWKLVDNSATKKAVSVAQISTDGAIVSSGLSEGDTLITSSLRKLREGALVNVLEKE